MASLKLLLGARQSACFANYTTNDQREIGVARSVFFTAEVDGEQKLQDKPLRATGHNVTVRELPDAQMSGVLEYSHGHDADGNPTQAQADITLAFSHHAFEQILNTDLSKMTLWLRVTTAAVSYESYGQFGGGGEAVIETVRLSFIPKDTHPQQLPTADILKLLSWILCTLAIIAAILVFR
ncbi:MAG: hypothetical protein BroJett010_26610 [Gammaproteobacteria bacterium]|nr:MAG: hypothetical protein BroJett010_26610 [Gammaproteobacteria bacterium]